MLIVTGKESNFASNEHKALSQFYKAFNEKNMELMEKNWLNSSEIAMDNPLGGIKRSWSEIREVYEKIFLNASVYVEFYDYSIITSSEMFCAIGRERGVAKIKGRELDLAIRTSRVFKLIDNEYKQVHHHGSIDNPSLLKEYQEMVLSS